MRVLITGGRGQLGCEVAALLRAQSWCSELLIPAREMLDLSRVEGLDRLIAESKPSLVINCAAWTSVDSAEEDPVEVMQINALAVQSLARACARFDAELVQISTDYVFDGWSEDTWSEDTAVSPQSVYGASKARAEALVAECLPESHLVVRTAWLYGRTPNNFVYKILARLLLGTPVEVVDDQRGSPSWARDVAARVVDLVKLRSVGAIPAGIYHAVNGGDASWFEFALAIARDSGLDEQLVRPIGSGQLPTQVARPANSVLGDNRALSLGLPPMRHWEDALRQALPVLQRDWFPTPI